TDVVVQSTRAFDDDLRQRVAAIAAATGPGASTELVDTQTMASSLDDVTGAVRLGELRGVESLYPFHGTLELDAGLTCSHTLRQGRGAVVWPELLVAIGIEPGDQFRRGGEIFTVRGVITRDRVARRAIAFGPRVYVDLADLRDTSLLGFGSRASYQILL